MSRHDSEAVVSRHDSEAYIRSHNHTCGAALTSIPRLNSGPLHTHTHTHTHRPNFARSSGGSAVAGILARGIRESKSLPCEHIRPPDVRAPDIVETINRDNLRSDETTDDSNRPAPDYSFRPRIMDVAHY